MANSWACQMVTLFYPCKGQQRPADRVAVDGMPNRTAQAG